MNAAGVSKNCHEPGAGQWSVRQQQNQVLCTEAELWIAGAASLQLITGNAMTASVADSAAEPFDRRFHINQQQSVGSATDLHAPEHDDRDGIEAAPARSAALPQRATAEAEEPAAIVQSTKSAITPAANRKRRIHRRRRSGWRG